MGTNTSDNFFTKIAYTYTGDLMTKIETYYKNETTATKTVDYTYNSDNKLTKEVSKDATNTSSYTEINYTYNSDGTITAVENSVSKTTGTKTLSSTTIHTYSAGNLTKSVTTYPTYSNTTTYEYDSKNTFFKNITGYQKFIDSSSGVNNLIKEVVTSSNSTTPTVYNLTYEYDANDYPIKRTHREGASTYFSVVEFTY